MRVCRWVQQLFHAEDFRFAVTMALTMGIGTLAINTLSVLAPMLVEELSISRAQLGGVAALTFAVAAFTSVVTGREVDRLSGRSTLMAVYVTGGAAGLALAGSQSLMWLWLVGLLCGMSQGIANTATNRLIADNIRLGARGLHVGIKQSGVTMAQAFSGLVLPPLAVVIGWRGSTLVGTGLVVAGIALVWAVIPGASGYAHKPAAGPFVGRGRWVWWLTMYAFMIALAVTCLVVYVPLYSNEVVGLSPAIAGMAGGFLGVVGIVSRIAWGQATDGWIPPNMALFVGACAATISLLLVLLSTYAGMWALWVGLSMFGMSGMGSSAVIMMAIIKGAPKGSTGQTSGSVGLGLFLGYMVGPAVFGIITDVSGSYVSGWWFLFIACAFAVLASCMLHRSTTA